MDDALHPARGQIVVVRNATDTMYAISGTDDGEDEIAYTMTRATGMSPLDKLRTNLESYMLFLRWRYYPWRFVPEGQLGPIAGPESRNTHNEALH